MENQHTPGEWEYRETLLDDDGSYGVYAPNSNKILKTHLHLC